MFFFQSGFHASLVAQLPTSGHVSASHTVEHVTIPALMEDNLDAYIVRRAFPKRITQSSRQTSDRGCKSLYLARIDGQPAAASTLFVHERVGYLADGSVISRSRPPARALKTSDGRRSPWGCGHGLQRRSSVFYQSSEHGTCREARAIYGRPLDPS